MNSWALVLYFAGNITLTVPGFISSEECEQNALGAAMVAQEWINARFEANDLKGPKFERAACEPRTEL